jgi:tetratricopeptide (TPR) repeat protein
VKLYLGALALLSLVAAFLPLADHLGYEASELVALVAGSLGAAPGIAAARQETRSPARALGRALGFALLALLLPVAVLLLNGLRRPACDPLSGLVLYVALAVPSALLSASLGVACGFVFPRRAPLAVAAVFAATLAAALWPLVRGPQVFVFAHLAGMYPGPIYDEAIAATPALWIFRGTTLLYAAACCGIALIAGPPQPRRRGFVLLAGAGTCAVLLSLQAERFHWKASQALLDYELSGRIETEHVVLHVPREKKEAERRLLAADAETSWLAVREFAALSGPAPQKIDVYLYRSAEEKRRLIGAAETSFTKPWLRQIHTNDAPAPHPILRHELAHAVAADVASGPWKVPGRLFGLVPNMALIEGFAVAADWPPGELTVHEETRAARALKLEPNLERLFGAGLFYAEAGPRAYTAAGSFVRWLSETRGRDFVRDVYAGKKPLGDLAQLSREHGQFLDALPLAPKARALAEQRLSAPAIVRKRCAHEVAGLQREAQAAVARGDPARAAELWSRCSELEPDDPALLLQLARAQAAAGELAAAAATQARALAHPKLSQPLRAQALTEAGDVAWKANDLAAAQARYDEAALLAQPEPAERALALRRRALSDPASWPALRRLLADGETGPEVWLALRDLDLARRQDGTFAYLLAKQLQNRGSWPECLTYARDALRRSLPGPLFTQEALRMQGIAAWHTGDAATARLAFAALGKDAPPGRALEAQRWLERLRYSGSN